MSEVFADEQLAAWVQSSTGLGELDMGAMRTGIAQRARTRARGHEMDSVWNCRLSGPSIGPAMARSR